jgi:hypothetical protein
MLVEGKLFSRRPDSGGGNCGSGLEVEGEASEDDSKVETSF